MAGRVVSGEVLSNFVARGNATANSGSAGTMGDSLAKDLASLSISDDRSLDLWPELQEKAKNVKSKWKCTWQFLRAVGLEVKSSYLRYLSGSSTPSNRPNTYGRKLRDALERADYENMTVPPKDLHDHLTDWRKTNSATFPAIQSLSVSQGQKPWICVNCSEVMCPKQQERVRDSLELVSPNARVEFSVPLNLNFSCMQSLCVLPRIQMETRH